MIIMKKETVPIAIGTLILGFVIGIAYHCRSTIGQRRRCKCEKE
jgi:hypothetical protein